MSEEQTIQVLETKQKEEELEVMEERYRYIKPKPIEVQEVVFIGEGTELDARVTKIVIGRLEDFIPIDEIQDLKVRENLEKRRDRPAYYIEFEVPELGISSKDVIVLSTHPSSRYIKLARRYGRIRVGDSVKVVNEGGRLKIV